MLRREFGLALAGGFAAAAAKAPSILVRGGWQSVNIGDIAHTPGLLAIIEKHIPGAAVTLVSSGLDRGVKELLLKRFPSLQVVEELEWKPGGPLEQAHATSDVYIQGSGASVHAPDLARWQQKTGKPGGVFGVTVAVQREAASGALNDEIRAALNKADFVFTRETQSLANVREAGIKSHSAFVPDATFSFDLKHEARAGAYLKSAGLAGSRFIAVVPRLRYTPYHEFRKVDWSAETIRQRVEANDRHKEEDHAKLREVVVAWVRKTGGKALLCPEMTYAIGIIDPLLYNPLPEDVKRNVVRRLEYWMPSEASSVYAQAEAVVSSECHSPILAAVRGTPCFYVRQPEDGIKGQMWTDLGVGDWAPRIEQISGPKLAELVLGVLDRRAESRERVRKAVAKAQDLHAEGMRFVRSRLAKS